MGNFTYLKILMCNKSRMLKGLSVSFLLLLVMGTKSAAQNATGFQSNQFYKVVSFGQKIDFGTVDESVTWTIANSAKNIYATILGNEINNYSFEEPGEYEINFHESKKNEEECHHPAFAEKFKVKVEAVRLTFDFSKILFSEQIVRGRNYSDLIITVPAKITTKDNSNAKLPAPTMSVAGLGVSFTVEPVEKEIVIGNKTQLLKYKLSGIVNQETYLMFDFNDFHNQVQTYNLHQVIK